MARQAVSAPTRSGPSPSPQGVCNSPASSVTGGHYIAYCQNVINGQWYEFDDQYVTEVHETVVQSAEAYVLFYRCVCAPGSRRCGGPSVLPLLPRTGLGLWGGRGCKALRPGQKDLRFSGRALWLLET